MYEQQKTPFTSQSSHFPAAEKLSKEDGVQIGPSDARALYLADKNGYGPEELPFGKQPQIAIEAMAIEIVDLPSYKIVDLSIALTVRLPEGIAMGF